MTEIPPAGAAAMQRIVIGVLFLLGSGVVAMLYLVAANAATPEEGRLALALARMATGLWLLWTCLFGALGLAFADPVARWIGRRRSDWRIVFVLFCIALAGLEEAVTTGMTNLGPAFGVALGEIYITASANWFDVVFLHSVIVIFPYFIALALILSRWNFSPFAVFLAFGVVGTLAEALYSANVQGLVMFPFWAFVYGLMVWLPARCLPPRPLARKPGVLAHLLLAPGLFLLAFPLVVLIVWLIVGVLGHPDVHF